jgi:hypothetical protein
MGCLWFVLTLLLLVFTPLIRTVALVIWLPFLGISFPVLHCPTCRTAVRSALMLRRNPNLGVHGLP